MKHTFLKYIAAGILTALTVSISLHAQEFKIGPKAVQVHGFATQGFVYTSGNNWLTMTTNGDGSFGMTDMGLNASSQVTNKFRIGAQVYDHNLGQLGQYHPDLDWAVADFRVKPWLGFRGGKVKTTFGLYTDTQDLDSLHIFSLMPQSIYPIDMRDASIAHLGGDVYGKVRLSHNRGSFEYTIWSGHRSDSIYSGYPLFLLSKGTVTKTYGGLQYGYDLRWNTPAKGLVVGASRMSQDIVGTSTRGGLPNQEHSVKDWTNQFYGQYTHRNLQLESEFRHYCRDEVVRNGVAEDKGNMKSWYIAGTYQVMKKLALGSYFSHYTVTDTFPAMAQDTSLPSNHDYDKVISGRVDINRFVYVKAEGHFMDGYGQGPFPNGFYPQQNPTFVPNTKALVLRTGFSF
ncbi:MAG: hypothetical protein ABSF70_03990 [Terracidiphilus sp.]|jgi:hypothetical protein